MDGLPKPDDLWGKLRAEGPAWHPLIDHSIDVAAVLETLLRTPCLRQRLARAGGIDGLDDRQIERLCFLAFIHDLGKCSLGFRAKAVPGLGRRTAGHIEALKPLFKGPLQERLSEILPFGDMMRWSDPNVLCELIDAVIAHHGRMPELKYNQGSDRYLCDGWTDQNGEPLRRLSELIEAGRSLYAGAFHREGDALPKGPAFQHLFAGFLMLADWLGSDFPFSKGEAATERQAFARGHAQKRIDQIGMGAAPAFALGSFKDQFEFSPRAAQSAIDKMALPKGSGSIVLLESETGSGKTEAALRYASRLMEGGLVDGCFVALPLRSAAVQLHGRMQRWLDATYGEPAPEALLAVPGYIGMGEAEGERLPDFEVQWSDVEDESGTDRLAGRWAAEHPKRYAAARFAVGTIDQALLGALAVKHAHMRSACLIRHLLVIDEVHASDGYMTALIERVLALFRATGGHVLLMSATVGAGTRERLVAGIKDPPPFDHAVAAPYPLITSNVGAPTPIKAVGTPKRVRIEALPLMDKPKDIAARAVEAIGRGARVLILRNTVTAAIPTEEAIEAALGADHPALFRVEGVATLHHGRFAAADRKLLDQAVEARFGKDASPGAAVVVGTQTLEQSLDIDADLLITDLCPIDVLLQRIGRLHRHSDRDQHRPDGFREARCVVLQPASPDLSPFLQHARHGIGKDRAYQNILAIEATRRLIESGPLWTIPDDNRRLVEEGTHPQRLDRIATELSSAWQKARHDLLAIGIAERAAARDHSIDFDKPFSDIEWPPAADKVVTRLGARDWLLPIDGSFTSPFGGPLTYLKIPDWMKPDGTLDDEPKLEVLGDGQLGWDDVRYRYDRFGLQRESS